MGCPFSTSAAFMAPSVVTPFIWGEVYIGHSNIMKSDRRELQHVKCLPSSSSLCGEGAQHTAQHALCGLQGCPRRSVRRQTDLHFLKTGCCGSLCLLLYPVGVSQWRALSKAAPRCHIKQQEGSNIPVTLHSVGSDSTIINLSFTCGDFNKGRGINSWPIHAPQNKILAVLSKHTGARD